MFGFHVSFSGVYVIDVSTAISFCRGPSSSAARAYFSGWMISKVSAFIVICVDFPLPLQQSTRTWAPPSYTWSHGAPISRVINVIISQLQYPFVRPIIGAHLASLDSHVPHAILSQNLAIELIQQYVRRIQGSMIEVKVPKTQQILRFFWVGHITVLQCCFLCIFCLLLLLLLWLVVLGFGYDMMGWIPENPTLWTSLKNHVDFIMKRPHDHVFSVINVPSRDGSFC